MCGIAGFIEAPGRAVDVLARVAGDVTDALAHRGPDDSGVWTDPSIAVALGNRRLAIRDLSPMGHQPMVSADGRFVLVFNGEIYNFASMREQLAGLDHRFRGRSDTEVLLAAVSQWGLAPALEHTNGMFALALWDRAERQLWLARDRVGEKPLYYGWLGGTFFFGSELKALRSHPDFAGEIDRDALTLFFRHKYIPHPWCIFKGIRKLPPGCVAVVRPDGGAAPVEPVPYWDATVAAEAAERDPFQGPIGEAVEQLDALLLDAVGLRMGSDVPLGALLSGGIDSSAVVALMQAQSDRPVRSFTIGFEEGAFDESSHATVVARHLGTDHTTMTVTARDALDTIPLLPAIYDEPFADSSQIPSYLVSKLARTHVTVALSGDGGDEVFGGYNRYVWVPRLARWSARMPNGARHTTAAVLSSVNPATWDRLLAGVGPYLPSKFRHRTAGDKLTKLIDGLRAAGPDELYRRLVSHWQEPSSLVIDGVEPTTPVSDPSGRPPIADFTQMMMFLDATTYLPEDILAKVDRASMASSLEVRPPYLDPRVVEFAWRLPVDLKIVDGVGKAPLRGVLDRYVPRHLVERPKMGFGVPIGDWLRGPLKEWAASLLDPQALARDGILRVEPIRRVWEQHVSGRQNRQYLLWDVLMFQSWLESSRQPVVRAGVA